MAKMSNDSEQWLSQTQKWKQVDPGDYITEVHLLCFHFLIIKDKETELQGVWKGWASVSHLCPAAVKKHMVWIWIQKLNTLQHRLQWESETHAKLFPNFFEEKLSLIYTFCGLISLQKSPSFLN